MKNSKGQAMIEFAFVLPFLMLFIIAAFCSGGVIIDYLTCSGIVRDAARDAAINGGAITKTNYTSRATNDLMYYSLDSGDSDFKVTDSSGNVRVDMTFRKKTNAVGKDADPYFKLLEILIPSDYQISCTMRSEKETT